MPFRVAEVEVMLLADPVTVEYEPVEEEEALDDELEEDVPDALKLTFTFLFWVIFVLQVRMLFWTFPLLLQPEYSPKAYPLSGVIFKVTVPFLP